MKPLSDYGFIRGVCYFPSGGPRKTERELGYAKRLQINSCRIWLDYQQYWQDPGGFITRLVDYVRIAHSLGISTMPILWNGNITDGAILEEGYRGTAEEYEAAIVGALRAEEGLLMWDLMNEPSWNDYLRLAPETEKPAREEKMQAFLRRCCAHARKLDPVNAITIGHTFVSDVEATADFVDVLCFHDYLATRARVEATYTKAEELSMKYGKPLLNSELACLCRANPYDMALEICERHHVGWYLFELMVHDYWADVHGIVYPDGTVRDPSIVAAILGFRRNRDARSRIRPNPNREGHAGIALTLAGDALKAEGRSTDDLLEAAEYCANLLEGSEMVPMIDPPTVRIAEWRRQPEGARDVEAIRAFTYEMALTLRRCAKII